MERVKNENKHIEKNCASRWSFIKDHFSGGFFPILHRKKHSYAYLRRLPHLQPALNLKERYASFYLRGVIFSNLRENNMTAALSKICSKLRADVIKILTSSTKRETEATLTLSLSTMHPALYLWYRLKQGIPPQPSCRFPLDLPRLNNSLATCQPVSLYLLFNYL